MPVYRHLFRARRRFLATCLTAALCLAASSLARADHRRPQPPTSGTTSKPPTVAAPASVLADMLLTPSKAELSPGDTVSFTLQAPDSLANPLPMVLSDGEGYMELHRQAPYLWTMTLPLDRVGKRVWQVVALGGSSQHQSNQVTINVGCHADRLARLEFAERDPLELLPGEFIPAPPVLIAHYRDGSQCKVIGSDEVQWRIVESAQEGNPAADDRANSDPGAASAGPSGLGPVVQIGETFLALRPGQVHLVATLGKTSATRTVRVARYSPTDADGDLFPDADEKRYGTDPYSPDTDADGSTDELEYGVAAPDAPHPLDLDANGTPDMLQNNLRIFPGFAGEALGVWISAGHFHNGRRLTPAQLPAPDLATAENPDAARIAGNGLSLSVADLPAGGSVHVRVYGLGPLAEISHIMAHNAFGQPSWTRLVTQIEGDAIGFDLVDGDLHDRDPSLGQVEILLSAIPILAEPRDTAAAVATQSTAAARWVAFAAALLGTVAFIYVRARRRRAAVAAAAND